MAVWSWLCLWSPKPSFLLQSRLIFFLSILLCPSLTRTYTFEYTQSLSFSPFPFFASWMFLFIRCLQTIRLELPFSTLLSLLISSTWRRVYHQLLSLGVFHGLIARVLVVFLFLVYIEFDFFLWTDLILFQLHFDFGLRLINSMVLLNIEVNQPKTKTNMLPSNTVVFGWYYHVALYSGHIHWYVWR